MGFTGGRLPQRNGNQKGRDRGGRRSGSSAARVEVPKEEEEGMAELMAKAAEAEAEVEEERFASLLLQHASRQSEDARRRSESRCY